MAQYNDSGPSRNPLRSVNVPREAIAHLIDDLVAILLIEDEPELEEADS